MAFSTQRVTSDGTLVLLDIAIEYFDRSEIAVLFDGVVNAYPWAWVGTTEAKVSFSPAVPNTVEVMLVRTTDLSAVRHLFTLGAKFTTQSLDEDLTQILHIAQEAKENATIEEVFNNLNMHGYRIINIGDGIDPQDAPSMAQMVVHDAQIVLYRDAAAASAAAAAISESNASASAAAAAGAASTAVAVHAGGTSVHAIASVTGLQTALDGKQATLVSGTNVKTVNGSSILGSGDLAVGVTDGDKGDVTVSSSGAVWTIDQKLTSGTAKATTSGTSVDFSPSDGTGIPSWAKRITVLLNNVSTNGSSIPMVQLGDSGGVETTGYQCKATTTGATTDNTTGFLVAYTNSPTYLHVAKIEICLISGTTYIASGLGLITTLNVSSMAGNKTLSATLDRIRLTTVNGTDIFDGGSVNILYE